MDLKTETWGKEINEIVNYESKELFSSDLQINSSGSLYRLHNRIIFLNEETNSKDGYELLLKVNKIEDRYEFNFNNFNFDEDGNMTTNNSAWFLLKKSRIKEKMNKYKLKRGDILKIGRIFAKIKDIKFEKNQKSKKDNSSFDFELLSLISNKSKTGNNKILIKEVDNLNLNDRKEINTKKNRIYSLANQRNATDPNLDDKIQILNLNTNNTNNINNNNNNINSNNNINNNNNNTNNKNIRFQEDEDYNGKEEKKESMKIKLKKSRICRICYLEEESELDDPLVQPCKCSGSLKYIHLKCLKHWILTKSCLKVEESDYCNVFLFKEVECEICKMKFPDLIKHNGKLYYLLDFSKDFKNYLILETITLDEEGNKFIYVISLLNKEIKIGRGILSDILLSDVSVSRIHCNITIEGNNVFLKDNDSKFGTLVLIQTPNIKMTENLPLFLQIGRTFLNFEIKLEQKSFFSCCGINENQNIFYYYMQNDKQVKLNSVLTVKSDIDLDKDNDGEEEEEKIENKSEKESKKENKDEIEVKNNNNDEIVVYDNNDDESIKIIIENE